MRDHISKLKDEAILRDKTRFINAFNHVFAKDWEEMKGELGIDHARRIFLMVLEYSSEPKLSFIFCWIPHLIAIAKAFPEYEVDIMQKILLENDFPATLDSILAHAIRINNHESFEDKNVRTLHEIAEAFPRFSAIFRKSSVAEVKEAIIAYRRSHSDSGAAVTPAPPISPSPSLPPSTVQDNTSENSIPAQSVAPSSGSTTPQPQNSAAKRFIETNELNFDTPLSRETIRLLLPLLVIAPTVMTACAIEGELGQEAIFAHLKIAIAEAKKEGKTLFFISKDPDNLESENHVLIIVHKGEIYYINPTGEVSQDFLKEFQDKEKIPVFASQTTLVLDPNDLLKLELDPNRFGFSAVTCLALARCFADKDNLKYLENKLLDTLLAGFVLSPDAYKENIIRGRQVFYTVLNKHSDQEMQELERILEAYNKEILMLIFPTPAPTPQPPKNSAAKKFAESNELNFNTYLSRESIEVLLPHILSKGNAGAMAFCALEDGIETTAYSNQMRTTIRAAREAGKSLFVIYTFNQHSVLTIFYKERVYFIDPLGQVNNCFCKEFIALTKYYDMKSVPLLASWTKLQNDPKELESVSSAVICLELCEFFSKEENLKKLEVLETHPDDREALEVEDAGRRYSFLYNEFWFDGIFTPTANDQESRVAYRAKLYAQLNELDESQIEVLRENNPVLLSLILDTKPDNDNDHDHDEVDSNVDSDEGDEEDDSHSEVEEVSVVSMTIESVETLRSPGETQLAHQLLELREIIANSTLNTKRPRHGFFAGNLPSDIRNIKAIFDGIMNNYASLHEGLNRIKDAAEETHQPIFDAAQRCLNILHGNRINIGQITQRALFR